MASVPNGDTISFAFDGTQEGKPFKETIVLTFSKKSKHLSGKAETFLAGASTSVMAARAGQVAVDRERAERAAARFIQFLETGNAPAGLFAADAFCDFTSPRWRAQAHGADAVVAQRRRGHPGPGKVVRFRVDPIPSGFVLELEEDWVHDGQRWYAREMFRADLEGDAIVTLSVYCTGDWDTERRAQHAREVRLLRP